MDLCEQWRRGNALKAWIVCLGQNNGSNSRKMIEYVKGFVENVNFLIILCYCLSCKIFNHLYSYKIRVQ
jgi:hypothetical protein